MFDSFFHAIANNLCLQAAAMSAYSVIKGVAYELCKEHHYGVF